MQECWLQLTGNKYIGPSFNGQDSILLKCESGFDSLRAGQNIMSFSKAYSDFKRSAYRAANRGLIRDKTPEEHKKMMDEYYKRQCKKG